ncbi:SRPBCC family protein [Flexithrix dorotheae]|uniref:SRPBCC family protein n=1 Tax=Flexithrix dorotheae TaxID=70993 RepID=UPI0003610658|nr:SRPBCC family protein [Flexithrix dorotheae]
MKVLKIIGIVLASLILLFVIIGFALPKDYGMERSIEIDAPVAQVYAQVNDFKNWESWSPFYLADPTMKLSYGSITAGTGATYSWESENSGEGAQSITATETNKSIDTYLDFKEQGVAYGHWEFEDKGGSTYVTWSFRGEAEGIMDKWMGVLIDPFLGPIFEDGLNRLKSTVEKS